MRPAWRWAILCVAGVSAGCSRGDDAAEAVPADPSAKFASEHFLQFLNKQLSLPAGTYTVVAATEAAGQSGNYLLTVTFDDGTEQVFNGQWTGSGGQVPAHAGNPVHAITLARPGGLRARLSSAVDAYLYLVDRTGAVVREDDNGAGGTDALVSVPRSQTNDPAYARAYYATIDRNGDRDTLAKWKAVNGFNAGEDAHVIFRDTKDLGYGRDLYFRDNGSGQYAFYVNNFVVDDIPGQTYGALNLNAAIAQASEYHIGTNAIEYGPIDADGVGGFDDVNFDGVVDELDYFPRFYNFSSTPPYERRLTVDLDGKGEKAMPVPCIVCHGGRADALAPNPVNANPESRFFRSGDTLAHLQPLDVGTFEYHDKAPWRREDLEPGLKLINKAVYDSYAANEIADFQYAEWNSTQARQMLEDWYGGVDLPATFNDTYVPSGWTTGGGAPAGASTLYTDLLAHNCRTCHLLRGIHYQSDVDFTTAAKFLDFAGRVEDLLYDRGVMPLATLTFNNFHVDDTLSELLASFLEDNAGFSHRAGDGSLLLPDRPVARAGPDRRSPSPVAVSGQASLFARTWAWSITAQPPGSNASLLGASTVRPVLSADTDGTYVLSLVVSDGATTSAPDAVTVTIDSGMSPAPANITFTTHIKPLLTSAGCTGCHFPGGGPPVFYTDPAGGDPAASQNRDVYDTIRSLVDFADPENSRLLLKPTGNHHGGGEVFVVGSANYNTLLDWILEGAREN